MMSFDVYVYKVENNPKGVNVFVSRSHPEFIKRIMEQEIPEVFDGTVEIMSVSREAGDRTKVAVRSHNPNVDAIWYYRWSWWKQHQESCQPFPPNTFGC